MRYVQDRKTGQMKGSIGDGKNRIPTSADVAPTDAADVLSPDLDTTVEAFHKLADSRHRIYPYSFDEYFVFGNTVLESVGTVMLKSRANSFRRSGISTLYERNGSTTFEEEFAVPFLTDPMHQEAFRKAVNASLPEDSKFEFVMFREPLEALEDPNLTPDLLEAFDPAAVRLATHRKDPAKRKTRAWSDIFIVGRYEGKTVYFPVNIKCSREGSSYDNTSSWFSAAYVILNDSTKGADKETFFTSLANGEFDDDSVTDYYFWNFTKGDPAKGDQLFTDVSHCSYLEFPDPDQKVFRYNKEQSFPLQIDMSKVAAAREEAKSNPRPMSILQRKKMLARTIVDPIVPQAKRELAAAEAASKALQD